MTIKTFRGLLPMGEQQQIHLSTNDGLTGYKIKKFQIISNSPGAATATFLAKIYLTDQTNKVTTTIDFNESDLLGTSYANFSSSVNSPTYETIIFDQEVFNQDIFVYIVDPDGGTTECSYYIELEQMKLDLNHSTYITVKNIRSRTQV